MAEKDDRRIREEYWEVLDEHPDLLGIVAELDALYEPRGRRQRFSAAAALGRHTGEQRAYSQVPSIRGERGGIRSGPRFAAGYRVLSRSLSVAGLGAFVAMVALIAAGMVTALSRMSPATQGNRLGPVAHSDVVASATPAPVTAASTVTAGPAPAVPHEGLGAGGDTLHLDSEVGRFVAALEAYRANRGKNDELACQYEKKVRSFLAPTLNGRTDDLEELRVYHAGGPIDEDGWPEPLSGARDGNRYMLKVAFEEDPADDQGTRTMKFVFERLRAEWKIASIERLE